MSKAYCEYCRGRGYTYGPGGKRMRCGLCNPSLTRSQRAQRNALRDQAYAPRPGDPTYEKYLDAQQELFGVPLDNPSQGG